MGKLHATSNSPAWIPSVAKCLVFLGAAGSMIGLVLWFALPKQSLFRGVLCGVGTLVFGAAFVGLEWKRSWRRKAAIAAFAYSAALSVYNLIAYFICARLETGSVVPLVTNGIYFATGVFLVFYFCRSQEF